VPQEQNSAKLTRQSSRVKQTKNTPAGVDLPVDEVSILPKDFSACGDIPSVMFGTQEGRNLSPQNKLRLQNP
jgi:hypothetical protein